MWKLSFQMKVMIKQHLIQNKITLQTASLSLFRLFIQGRTQDFVQGAYISYLSRGESYILLVQRGGGLIAPLCMPLDLFFKKLHFPLLLEYSMFLCLNAETVRVN